MVKVETLESVLELFQNKDVQEKASELARLFYSGGGVTINLLPIFFFSFLAALLFLPLLLPAYDALSGLYSSAVGYSNVAYSSNYGSPVSGYGYQSRSSNIELSDEQKSLYPEISELREKIEKLQEDEYNLRSQIYYGTYDAVSASNPAAAYTY